VNDPAVVHQQAATVVADAVIQLTKRAIEPTIQPFTTELRKITKELRDRVDSIDGAHRDFRKLAGDLDGRMTELTAELTALAIRAPARGTTGRRSAWRPGSTTSAPA
jgi:hypothetical protein